MFSNYKQFVYIFVMLISSVEIIWSPVKYKYDTCLLISISNKVTVQGYENKICL